MKSLTIIAYFLFIFIDSLTGQKVKPNLYSIKSAIIEYTYSGNKVGKGTFFFDDYGRKSALVTDAVEDGEKRTMWIVTSGNYQYLWKPSNPNEGMKLENPVINWIRSNSNGDIETFTESMYYKMGLEKAGTEKFLDKKCIVLKGKPGKVLIWNGITLLLDINMNGSNTHEEATDIQINIPVAKRYFIIPEKITFMELPLLR